MWPMVAFSQKAWIAPYWLESHDKQSAKLPKLGSVKVTINMTMDIPGGPKKMEQSIF